MYVGFFKDRPSVARFVRTSDDLLSKGEVECGLDVGAWVLWLVEGGEGGEADAEAVGSEFIWFQLRVGER